MKTGIRLVLQIAVISIFFAVVFAPPVDDELKNENGVPDKSKTASPTESGEKKKEQAMPTPAPSPATTRSVNNSSKCLDGNSNSTSTNCTGTDDSSLFAKLTKNKGMLQRAVYVLLGVTAVVLLYFGLRMWRTRRRKSKTKKYGVLTTPGSDLEMTPLDQDDDDEDMTVFEVNGLHK